MCVSNRVIQFNLDFRGNVSHFFLLFFPLRFPLVSSSRRLDSEAQTVLIDTPADPVPSGVEEDEEEEEEGARPSPVSIEDGNSRGWGDRLIGNLVSGR